MNKTIAVILLSTLYLLSGCSAPTSRTEHKIGRFLPVQLGLALDTASGQYCFPYDGIATNVQEFHATKPIPSCDALLKEMPSGTFDWKKYPKAK